MKRHIIQIVAKRFEPVSIGIVNFLFSLLFLPIIASLISLVASTYKYAYTQTFTPGFWVALLGFIYGCRITLEVLEDINGPIQQRQSIILLIKGHGEPG